MELILLPKEDISLKSLYHRAMKSSVELYIVSAYLTHWDIGEKLGPQCESFRFIVGKDFGLTRKAACNQVLNWLPKKRLSQFLVAEAIDGFHPKAMFWREKDSKCYALVGSSNLSKAAFSTNHEANGYSQISQAAFRAARVWVNEIGENCVTLDAGWLSRYREAVQPKKPLKTGDSSVDDTVLDLDLPKTQGLKSLDDTLAFRRKQIKLFRKEKGALETLFRKTARARAWSEERNLGFYNELNSRWVFGEGGSRFQGAGWERQGKGSNFHELAKSIVRVLDAEDFKRDDIVSAEIDRLGEEGVTTRGALFSEMLCQFFPQRYHLIDQPVYDWLESTGTRSQWGATEGVKYISSARLLRTALKQAKNYPAKNLAELDAIIWLAVNQDKL